MANSDIVEFSAKAGKMHHIRLRGGVMKESGVFEMVGPKIRKAMLLTEANRLCRRGNLQEANKAVKLLRQIHNGRKDLAIKGLQGAAKEYYDPFFGRKGMKGISSDGTRSWARKLKSTKEARKAAARFDRAAKGVSPISPKSTDALAASRSATAQAHYLGAGKLAKNTQAAERSMAKAEALSTRMSPKSMEKHAKRTGISLTDAEVTSSSSPRDAGKQAGSLYNIKDKLIHIQDRKLPDFVHEGGVKGGGHHAVQGQEDLNSTMSRFNDELSASTTGIKAARRAGMKVTQADARNLTKALGTYATDPATQSKFIGLAKRRVLRKLASRESIVVRAGNLQEAITWKRRLLWE